MVRVISVHNFLKQEISSVDEVIDVISAPPDKLLLVQSNHSISVKDLSNNDDPIYSIPTVDKIVKIVYSVQGNYIASLESKLTRNGNEVYYVRVYMNWESLKKFKECPPMRARIAGRVTPLSQNQQGLEMIEIPAHNIPDNVTCCPVSGNLMVSSKNILSIYKFITQTHDISKIQFIDFEAVAVDLQLTFIPLRIQLIENTIAAQNDEYLHVFQFKSILPTFSLSDKEFLIEDSERLQDVSMQKFQKQRTIDLEKLLKENRDIRYQQFIESHKDHTKKTNTENSNVKFVLQVESSKISLSSFPIQHIFPTITAEKSSMEPKCTDILRQNPFSVNRDLSVNIVNIPSVDAWKLQYRITNLLQYQLRPLIIGSATNREIQEKFTCLILKPYYLENTTPAPLKRPLLESNYYSNFQCVACFFGTQQEGYLHWLEYHTSESEDATAFANYVVYPFTAPVIDVQLEDFLVHTLTDTGLETYTMRAAKHLIKSSESSACPSCDDPICLIGLRPFLKVLKICITNNYLVLFANNEEALVGMWTLYQLQLPDAATLWNDFLTLANENKWEALATYGHLVGEGHLILKTFLNCVQWSVDKGKTKSQMHLAVPSKNGQKTAKVIELYKESCALLGDFHILNREYESASNYYKMSGYKISNIIKRIQSLHEGVPSNLKAKFDAQHLNRGLIFHLKKTLSDYDQKYSAFSGNREEFYNPEIGNLVTVLMDLLEREERSSMSDLVLGSIVLREYSTDRILKMMKHLLSKSSVPQEKDALSLALMCIQRGQNDQARTVLLTMKTPQLQTLLLQYPDLLFEKNEISPGFAELSMILIEIYPDLMVKVLSALVIEKRILNLSHVVPILLDRLPTGGIQSRNCSMVLQNVLEKYFKCYYSKHDSKKSDFKIVEILKILIRIYLSHLQQKITFTGSLENDITKETSEILFYKLRPNYLNFMPPLGPDLNQILSPQHGSISSNQFDKDQRSSLIKLQSLLSNKHLPDECFSEVKNFVSKQAYICGSLSLQALCASNVPEAAQLLLNFAPQALVQFAKECMTEKEEWKTLVSMLRNKINGITDDSRRKFYHERVLSDILQHVAENRTVEDLLEIIPKNYEESERYLTIAQNNAQANHIRSLIIVTGKQLLASL